MGDFIKNIGLNAREKVIVGWLVWQIKTKLNL